MACAAFIAIYLHLAGAIKLATLMWIRLRRTRNPAGMIAAKLRPMFDERAKARMEIGRPKEGVEKIPQVTAKARDEA
jgi:hypothetical protein